MEVENLARWDPCHLCRDAWYIAIVSILDDREGFRLLITTNDKYPTLRVSVPKGAILAYRVYDESGLEGRKLNGFMHAHRLYTIEASPFLSDTLKMYGGMRDDLNPTHYAIYTANECIDIISTKEPSFILLNEYKYIGDLFEEEPIQWGLRGDPFLWKKMRLHFSELQLPEDITTFENILTREFLELTGHPITYKEIFSVKEFAHGGMSSGGISTEFWRERALPLLRSRFESTLTSNSA